MVGQPTGEAKMFMKNYRGYIIVRCLGEDYKIGNGSDVVSIVATARTLAGAEKRIDVLIARQSAKAAA